MPAQLERARETALYIPHPFYSAIPAHHTKRIQSRTPVLQAWPLKNQNQAWKCTHHIVVLQVSWPPRLSFKHIHGNGIRDRKLRKLFQEPMTKTFRKRKNHESSVAEMPHDRNYMKTMATTASYALSRKARQPPKAVTRTETGTLSPHTVHIGRRWVDERKLGVYCGAQLPGPRAVSSRISQNMVFFTAHDPLTGILALGCLVVCKWRWWSALSKNVKLVVELSCNSWVVGAWGICTATRDGHVARLGDGSASCSRWRVGFDRPTIVAEEVSVNVRRRRRCGGALALLDGRPQVWVFPLLYAARWVLLYANLARSIAADFASSSFEGDYHLNLGVFRFGAVILAFFFSSSQLTKYKSDAKKSIEEDFKDGGQRDW